MIRFQVKVDSSKELMQFYDDFSYASTSKETTMKIVRIKNKLLELDEQKKLKDSLLKNLTVNFIDGTKNSKTNKFHPKIIGLNLVYLLIKR